MPRWITAPESTARGLVVWLALVAGMAAVVFSDPTRLAEGQEPPLYLGAMPFAAAALGYLCYRRPNPFAAVVDIVRGLARPESDLRGWLVGFAVVATALAGLEAALWVGVVDDQPWLAWAALAIGAIFGHAASNDAHLLRAARVGLRRTLWVGLALLGVAAAVAVAVGGVVGIRSFFDSYGILGAIAVLLAIIVFQLDRLIASRGHDN